MRTRRALGAVLVATVALPLTLLTGAPAHATAHRAETSYRRTIAVAIADIQSYWSDEFPDLYGTRYQPVPQRRIIAGRPGVKLPPCQGDRLSYRDVADNAFYCLHDNFVVYDDAHLFPDLYSDTGPFAVALVLAHEFGHAVQDRAGIEAARTIEQELQADCFAGGWTEHVAADGGPVPYSAGDLEISLAALLQFRDAPGSSPDDPSAHGSAFDRVNAFQDGFEFGPERCAAYEIDPPLVVQLPFSSASDASQGGNVPAADVIPLTVDLLNDFYSQVEPRYSPLSTRDITSFDSTKRTSIPKCGSSRLDDEKVKNRVFYCLDDGYIAFDEPFLQDVYNQIGDFGVSTLLASPWATYVQTIQGIPGVGDNSLAAVLQADCYTGGWAAAFYNGFLAGGSLSPGDLDETVMALLVYSRARGVSADIPISFVRVRFFRQGFFSGYQSCGYDGIARDAAKI
jgi:predicted metalloprotease